MGKGVPSLSLLRADPFCPPPSSVRNSGISSPQKRLWVPIVGTLLSLPFLAGTLLLPNFYLAMLCLLFEYILAEQVLSQSLFCICRCGVWAWECLRACVPPLS